MKDDGGSAFPEVTTDGPDSNAGRDHPETYSYGGMSLRDYFAAKAMQGILSNSDPHWPHETPEVLAACCYQTADAMLAERDKP